MSELKKGLCSFCNLDCSREMKFIDDVLNKWGLTPPMHLHCSIICLVEKKIAELKQE
jgi:hypothetical protein